MLTKWIAQNLAQRSRWWQLPLLLRVQRRGGGPIIFPLQSSRSMWQKLRKNPQLPVGNTTSCQEALFPPLPASPRNGKNLRLCPRKSWWRDERQVPLLRRGLLLVRVCTLDFLEVRRSLRTPSQSGVFLNAYNTKNTGHQRKSMTLDCSYQVF